jgi:hypothetical protein
VRRRLNIYAVPAGIIEGFRDTHLDRMTGAHINIKAIFDFMQRAA